MKVTQIASVLNDTIMEEITGLDVVVAEDLSNIVDAGKSITDFLSGAGTDAVNSFVSTLIDRIGRVKFVDRTYRSQAPNILHDSWEYGSIMMKVRAEVPDFQENTSWKLGALNGQGIASASELDPFVISAPTATAKFYNSKITYEAPITIGEIQLKQAFTSAAEMGRFIATIENRIQLKMTLSTDALIMRTLNNLIASKIAQGENVVNLLTEYNSGAATPLTAEQALRSTEFLRFATKTIALYKDYLKTAGSLYNSGDYITFTPEENLKFVVLSEFAKDMETYLYSDTYHNEFVKMTGYSTVPFWQGTGTSGADFESRSTINVKPAGITLPEGQTSVEQTGVVAVMFDEQAAAVCNENYRVTSQYNARGEYTNYFYKWDANYMNDTEENVIVFIIADKT